MMTEADVGRVMAGVRARPLVAVLSPWRGEPRRRSYLLACLRDSLARGEAPYASHAMFAATGLLRDEFEAERALGLACGLAWELRATMVAVYADLGVSEGMRASLARAREAHLGVDMRRLGGAWEGVAR